VIFLKGMKRYADQYVRTGSAGTDDPNRSKSCQKRGR
jgi:hypothetical protein